MAFIPCVPGENGYCCFKKSWAKCLRRSCQNFSLDFWVLLSSFLAFRLPEIPEFHINRLKNTEKIKHSSQYFQKKNPLVCLHLLALFLEMVYSQVNHNGQAKAILSCMSSQSCVVLVSKTSSREVFNYHRPT